MFRTSSITRLVTLSLTFVMCFMAVGSALAADPVFTRMETSAGDILIVLYPELAPKHVQNFTHLSESGFYQDSYFHRVIPGFMIQGGDPNTKDDNPRNDGMGSPKLSDVLTADEQKLVAQVNDMLNTKGFAGGNQGALSLEQPFNLKQEFSSAKHFRGTLSMARAQNPDSAGSQFFVFTFAPDHNWSQQIKTGLFR